MQRFWSLTAAAATLVSASGPAHACMMPARLDLNDVKYADLVVVGRVSNYTIVRDLEFRRKMLASPTLPSEMRKFYEGPNTLMSDYARFDIRVDQVLAGNAPPSVTVTWDNSTFGEPEKMAAGPFLIALRRPSSAMPPLRGPSATIMANREPGNLTVLQAPCASPFIFESGSEEARRIRVILGAPRQ